MAKVSVLVAVYNAAPYLSKCLDSLICQTLADIQIICVDDGSTDGSAALLDEYAVRDRRIRVVHFTANKGLAKARNAGLELATGEYICMLDADDWFSPEALESAYDVFGVHPLTDCVLFKFVLAYPKDGGQYEYRNFDGLDFEVLSGTEACELSLSWKIHGIYLVRADIHKRYPYDDTCRLYSDENTTRVHYAVSREVRCCDGIYYYLQHPESETHKLSVRKFDVLKATESLYASLEALDMGRGLLDSIENCLWLKLVDVYMFYHCYGHILSAADRAYGLSEMRRVWNRVDRLVIDVGVRRKFGYCPMPSWALFRLQEWMYFTLRGMLGKNN